MCFNFLLALSWSDSWTRCLLCVPSSRNSLFWSILISFEAYASVILSCVTFQFKKLDAVFDLTI